jgi:threonine synthase
VNSPVTEPENIVSLGEGFTPLVKAERLGRELGLSHLYIKDESQNITGSFKARGLAVAGAKAHELGVQEIVIPSAGNAGGALAAYAARVGVRAHIFMPQDTPQANICECQVARAGSMFPPCGTVPAGGQEDYGLRDS